MADRKFFNFDMLFQEASGGKTSVSVINSPAGEASREFKIPFSPDELEYFLLKITRFPSITDKGEFPDFRAAREFGTRLFEAVFQGSIYDIFRRSLNIAGSEDSGLCIRMRLDSPELNNLPWEFLYDPDTERFLSLSVSTQIVRYLELPERVPPLSVKFPLRILAIFSNPNGFPALNVDSEWEILKMSTATLQQQGLIEVTRLENASLRNLRLALRTENYHVIHYYGHSVYDSTRGGSSLVFEMDDHQAANVDAEMLGTLLHDHRTMRLVVLNACEEGIFSSENAVNDLAKTLLYQGIPAVVGMQFEFMDRSAAVFNQEFYSAIVKNIPLDEALAEARKAIFAEYGGVEWATPALFTRAAGNQIFEFLTDQVASDVQVSKEASELERAQLIRRANREMDTVIGRLANYKSTDMVIGVQKELDWFPQSRFNELEPDIVEVYPRLIVISNDMSAAQQLDVYTRRLGFHEALQNLDLLRKRLPILGEKAKRWDPVLAAWKNIFVIELEKLQNQGNEVQIPNLYQPGNPLQLSKRALFKGRHELRDAVVNALLEKTRPTIIMQGPRRMGKTSFLQQLPALLPGKTIPVFLDMQKPSMRANDGAFLYGIARAICDSATPYYALLQIPDRETFISQTFMVFDEWLDDKVLSKMKDFNFLIAFDEFEKLGQAIAEKKLTSQVLDELRYTIQHRTQVALLFAGVQTLDELGPDWTSYFINVRAMTIGYLSLNEAEELIRNPEPGTAFPLEYSDEAVKCILRDTLGHPYLIQLVCSCVVELANNAKKKTASIETIDEAETLALERGEPYFRNVWDEMAGPEGQPILRQLAAAKKGIPLHEDSSQNKIINKMVKLKVLKQTPNGYAIEVPLVQRWIKERAPE